MRSKIDMALIEVVAKEMDRLGYGHHESHAESILHAIQGAAPVVERQDGSALMKIAADLANRKPLRQLYLACEHQGRINTDSLHEHLDKCGDLLAGIALDIRRAITAPPELAELQATIARLQREQKNDAIAYKAVIEKQDEIRSELDGAQSKIVRMKLLLSQALSMVTGATEEWHNATAKEIQQ